jgi:FKBP-type peptidyl-prolyl cis-trans isomerase
LKKVSSLILTAVFVAGCAMGAPDSKPAAAAPEAKPAAARTQCVDPPKELVTRDLEEGTGEPIVFRTAVLMSYTGWVYDPCAPGFKGEMFDSSSNRPTPFGFMVGAGRVIKGWDEGVLGMKKGGRRLLIIPPDKAYGARSPSPKIPANSTLVFEVGLVEIVGVAPPRNAPAGTPSGTPKK